MCIRPTICLFIACLCLPRLSDAAGVRSSGTAEVLRLETALEQALANNLGLSAARYAPANASDALVIEQAAFDVELFGSTSRSESQAAASTSTLDSASVPQSERRRSRIGVEKRLSSGATLTLGTGIGRRSSNNNAARNPDYATDVGLSVRQPLWQGAGQTVNLAPLARARVAAEQSLFELRTAILDVIAKTEIAYWNLAHARAELALIASSLKLAENLLEENREREQLGLVTPLEVLQAEAELVRQQEAEIQAERAIADATDLLREQMGTVSFLDDLSGEVAVRSLPAEMPAARPLDAIVRDALFSDADAQAQQRALEVQRIQEMLAEDAIRADLDLTAEVNYTGRDSDGTRAYRDAYAAKGYDWAVGLELRFPWGLREARAEARQAKRNVARETVRLYAIKQQKALAARTAWRAVHAGQQRIAVTRKALELNQQTFEQARARYGAGLVAYRQVLEAQRDFDRARSQHLSALIDTLRATVRLSRVDGTILARNGFSWQSLEALAEAPELEAHPQGRSILSPDS
jgi:outer membrane protein